MDLRDTLDFSGITDLAALEGDQEQTEHEPEDQPIHQPIAGLGSYPKNLMDVLKVSPLIPTRCYSFDISLAREVKGELKISGQFGKDHRERLKKAIAGQLSMIDAALED